MDGTYREKILTLLQSIQREGMNDLINYITTETDFFEAPASTKYHSNFPGGLAEHSYRVYESFNLKNDLFKLGLSEETIIISSLLHDLCKVNFYTIEKKNVLRGKKILFNGKETNNWVEEDVYVINNNFPIGHSEKSIISILKYIKLSDLEIMLIRWHMGFTESKESYQELNRALELYPAIIALHTADLEATYLLEKRQDTLQPLEEKKEEQKIEQIKDEVSNQNTTIDELSLILGLIKDVAGTLVKDKSNRPKVEDAIKKHHISSSGKPSANFNSIKDIDIATKVLDELKNLEITLL